MPIGNNALDTGYSRVPKKGKESKSVLLNSIKGGPREVLTASNRRINEKDEECSGALPCMEQLSVELDFNDLSALFEK